ncbi:MAG: hypothetical protein IPL92_17885 [Saprospiraceae bacterium]|nr:hypothetical protein [Candidatus Opimibacter iunctus]
MEPIRYVCNRNPHTMPGKYTHALISLLTVLAIPIFAQRPMIPDLHKDAQHHKIEVYNRVLSLIKEDSYQGIRLNKDYGEGVAWMKGITFSTGTLEFDVRGENVKQHSFVGIAFHGQNDSTYDAIYLRPFHFYAEDQVSQDRMIQFISPAHLQLAKAPCRVPGTVRTSNSTST